MCLISLERGIVIALLKATAVASGGTVIEYVVVSVLESSTTNQLFGIPDACFVVPIWGGLEAIIYAILA